MAFNKNVIFYLVMAVIVIAIIYVLASTLIHPAYSISVHLYNSSGANLYPFNTTDFAIVINNTGSYGVHDMLVGFYIDGSALHLYNASIPAHKSAVIYTNYTYTANGTYTFSAIADPGHVIDIPDRGAATASVTMNVSQNESGQAYSSMPNNGIVSSYNFSLVQNIGPVLAELSKEYNISRINSLLVPNRTIVYSIMSDLYGTLNAVHGAVASYSNGSSAYAVWLQGTGGPGVIDKIISSFGYSASAEPDGTQVFGLGNGTSACVSFSDGWTKIIAYHSVGNGTCASFSSAYTPTRSAEVYAAMNSSAHFLDHVSRFFYNTSAAGFSYLGNTFGEGNGSVSGSNIFQNNYGIFISYMNRTSADNSNPGRCFGLLSNNSAVCSVYVLQNAGSNAPLSLVKSEELTKNYRIELYSFVNSTEAVNAHINAYDLIKSLNVSQTPLPWKSAFNDTCSIPINGISCGITGFNYTSNTASMNITNNLNMSLKLNYDSCYISGLQVNETVNRTIAPHSSISQNVKCYNIPVPLLSAVTSYNLYLNYTLDNRTGSTYGTLNVTNEGYA
ncbi:MAG: hypothetical protein ACP5MZ_03075 [Candidatus Micrarchaeia archaeon]